MALVLVPNPTICQLVHFSLNTNPVFCTVKTHCDKRFLSFELRIPKIMALLFWPWENYNKPNDPSLWKRVAENVFSALAKLTQTENPDPKPWFCCFGPKQFVHWTQSTLQVRPNPHRTRDATQMEPIDVNGSVHTARKQRQRICVRICARASCVDEALNDVTTNVKHLWVICRKQTQKQEFSSWCCSLVQNTLSLRSIWELGAACTAISQTQRRHHTVKTSQETSWRKRRQEICLLSVFPPFCVQQSESIIHRCEKVQSTFEESKKK